MPIIKSAKKRVRQAEKRRIQLSKYRRRLHDVLKDFNELVKAGNLEEASKMLSNVYSTIDTCDKKNIIHANKAARLKSQAQKAVSTKS